MNKEEILDILGDSDNRIILVTLGNKKLSGQILRRSSGLPSSSFYRKLNALVSNQILLKSDNGIKTGFDARAKYKTNILDLKIHLDKSGHLKMELETIKSVLGSVST